MKPSLPMSRLPTSLQRLDTTLVEWRIWAARWTHRWFRQEAVALREHHAGLQERWRVAQRTRDPIELLRLQIDLLPVTTARLAQDHARRVRGFRRLKQRLASIRLR